MNKKIILVLACALILSACGSQTAVIAPTATPAPKLVEMAMNDRPKIILTPRQDGHMLYLKINKISANISQIDYELLYDAGDNGAQIEKGLSDTIKDASADVSRDLLLGTESCTSGCKYNYDAGVTGGTLTMTFTTKNGQVSTFVTPFTLNSTADIKKSGEIKLPTENFSVKPKTKLTGSDYFLLMKNYLGGYTVFSSGTNTLAGDYPQP